MDLRLTPATMTSPVRQAAGVAGAGAARLAGAQAQEEFSGALKSALQAVSQAQNQVTQLQRDVTLENPNASLEQTMMAIQKAQIAFQATVHVRNRMVQAYTDIMNMQV